MNIENKKANDQKLCQYGFKNENGIYTIYKQILNGEFELKIEVQNNKINTQLKEKQTGEIYTLHLMSNPKGAFIGQIKEAYEKIISDIVTMCFETDIFKSPQTKAIIEYLKKKYNTDLEYLWEKYPDNAVFRRKDNNKWFGLILTVKKNKLGFKGTEPIEIIDLKADPDEILNIIDNKKYYKGYHMNKKTWITMVLDNSVCLEELCERIDKSYELASK